MSIKQWKDLKEKIRKYNNKSNKFIFNRTSMTTKERDRQTVKFFISSELRESLNSFRTDVNDILSFILFTDRTFVSGDTYNWWIKISKETVREKAEGDTLHISSKDYELISQDQLLSNMESDLKEIEAIEETERKEREKTELRNLVIQEIKNEVINKAKISFSELAGYYVVSLPDNCHCEIIPNSSDFLFADHVRNCLSSIEEIKKFKDDMISAIWQVKKELDDLKERTIREIENKLVEKGINENDFFQEQTDWREKIKNSFRTEKVEKERLTIIKGIEKFSNSSSEGEKEQSRQEYQNESEELGREEGNKNKEEKQQGQQKEEEFKKHLAEEEKKNENEKEEKKKNNQSDKPNNPLPSPIDIQNNYNSDKAKSEIENNPNLTNPKEQNQAQDLLKLIITAELLIKEQKFNLETLSQLIKEKEQNTPSYQVLNQEGRMDKVIKELQNIQKSQEYNNSVDKSKSQLDNKFPTGIIVGGISFLLVLLSVGIIWKKRKKRIKIR